LGLFQGGVFEMLLLLISQIAPERWAVIKAELVATALVKVDAMVGKTKCPPYVNVSF